MSNKKKINKRKKSARETERVILDYLKSQEKPISFYNLYKSLGFSSGKAQTALKRMEENKTAYLKKRIKRFENLVWYKEFQVKPNIIDLESDNLIFIPISINRTIGLILQEIPNLTPEFIDLTSLFKRAIISFFREKIPLELRQDAILKAIQKKNIPQELGKQLLGE
jgi:hypothetical protein